MSTVITADVLYDLVNCPHRVTMDTFGDPAERDPINALVELLWNRGTAFEDEVIADLTRKLVFVNLRHFAGAEKEQKTLEAMRSGAPLTYGGGSAQQANDRAHSFLLFWMAIIVGVKTDSSGRTVMSPRCPTSSSIRSPESLRDWRRRPGVLPGRMAYPSIYGPTTRASR